MTSVFLALFSWQSFDPAQAEDCLFLKQSCRAVGPDCKVYLKPTAVRIESGTMTIVINAPDWQFCFANSVQKKFLLVDFNKGLSYMGKLRASYLAFTTSGANWKKTGKGMMLGMQTQKWKTDGDSRSALIQWQECSTLSQLKSAPQIVKVVQAIYGLPDLGQIPVQFVYFGKPTVGLLVPEREVDPNELKPKLQTWLNTISVEHKTSFAPELFTAPKGYEKTSSLGEVTVRNLKDNAIIKDLLSNPDVIFQSR